MLEGWTGALRVRERYATDRRRRVHRADRPRLHPAGQVDPKLGRRIGQERFGEADDRVEPLVWAHDGGIGQWQRNFVYVKPQQCAGVRLTLASTPTS